MDTLLNVQFMVKMNRIMTYKCGLHKTSERIRNRRKSLTWKVENETELAEVLMNITVNNNQLIFIEVVMSQGISLNC